MAFADFARMSGMFSPDDLSDRPLPQAYSDVARSHGDAVLQNAQFWVKAQDCINYRMAFLFPALSVLITLINLKVGSVCVVLHG